ncbi:lysophospholipid acyltransferase family protein [uncultured Maricaulis sp.]|uniref:lysophospholipid acyltransferase family protein n=1 Tax=uncultured Maricaulis sp. TaxID=174710 RepID=UPI0030D74563|tara:strand:- start:5783 stop:6568 length:786 start_codon:yes stop_codon:yes gene_type:complete
MRSLIFNLAYYTVSAVYAVICAILALVPGRRILMHGIRSYARLTVLLMRWICGIKVEVRGTPPKNQAVILAAKHQSWGDGLAMMAKCGDVNFICGDHMLNYPLIGWVLKRCGAIVVSNQGGAEAMASLRAGVERSQGEGRPRPILIYPEGHLTPVGTGMRYRSGAWQLSSQLDRPVVPVATNLGQCWPQQKWSKFSGTAVIEFLEPMPPSPDRNSFLAELETRVETRSRALEAEFAAPVRESVSHPENAEKTDASMHRRLV